MLKKFIVFILYLGFTFMYCLISTLMTDLFFGKPSFSDPQWYTCCALGLFSALIIMHNYEKIKEQKDNKKVK